MQPRIEKHGQGLRVNGVEVSGEEIVSWLRDYADRGYAIKMDEASTCAFARTDADYEAQKQHVPLQLRYIA